MAEKIGRNPSPAGVIRKFYINITSMNSQRATGLEND